MLSTLLVAALFGGSALALDPVTVKGNAFFRGNERFYVRGIAYQPGGAATVSDPLADVEGCKRDADRFEKLGLNTIRVYSVDNSPDAASSHDECMQYLESKGIYVALDVNTPSYSLNRGQNGDDEPIKMSYNSVYLQSVFATVEAFMKYDNTLLFFSANEVIDGDTTTHTAPYIKAVTRDIRRFIKERSKRPIPVGYSAADVDSNRLEMAHYMDCGHDDLRADFFAFNDYSWCSPSSFEKSGWDKKVQTYENYGAPIFLSEFGCIKGEVRDFSEVGTLLSDQMSSVYSGGIAYEYTMEANKYGIVELDGSDVKELDGYEELAKALSSTSDPSGDGGYKEKVTKSECPARSDKWDVEPDTVPAMPEGAEKFFKDGAGDGPGLKGDGSQTASDDVSKGEVSINDPDKNASGKGGDNSGASSVGVSAAAIAVGALAVAAIGL